MIDRTGILGKSSHAQTDGIARDGMIPRTPVRCLGFGGDAQSFGQCNGALLGGVGQDDRKLLTTVTGGDIRLTDFVIEQVANLPDAFITGGMSPQVVELFKESMSIMIRETR